MSFPAFDQPVPDNGYAWWYIDALSDDQRFGFTVIAFIGSVFSPYYAWARRHGPTPARAHCAINVALYGPRGRWAMTERGAGALAIDRHSLKVGPSAIAWNGQQLTVDIDEWAVPVPRRLRGRIRIETGPLNSREFALDAGQDHIWSPVAPSADISAEFDHPRTTWRGTGYVDHNRGSAPLETTFARWQWSRAALTAERAAVLYDVERRDGSSQSLALHFDSDGTVERFAPPPIRTLPTTAWRIGRASRSESNAVRVVSTLENAPFYARSIIAHDLLGQRTHSVHESLSLTRFCNPLVQCMLPFRMPRRARWNGR